MCNAIKICAEGVVNSSFWRSCHHQLFLLNKVMCNEPRVWLIHLFDAAVSSNLFCLIECLIECQINPVTHPDIKLFQTAFVRSAIKGSDWQSCWCKKIINRLNDFFSLKQLAKVTLNLSTNKCNRMLIACIILTRATFFWHPTHEKFKSALE